MRNFREYKIWHSSIELSSEVYHLTSRFPPYEKYGLSSQLQRAAVSIAANIAEGASRDSERDFARFLEIAIGSAFELETLATISNKVGFLEEGEFNNLIVRLTKLEKQIQTLLKKVRTST